MFAYVVYLGLECCLLVIVVNCGRTVVLHLNWWCRYFDLYLVVSLVALGVLALVFVTLVLLTLDCFNLVCVCLDF